MSRARCVPFPPYHRVRYVKSPLSTISSVPQGPKCHEPVVCQALCTTGSEMSRARCVPGPLYHRVRYVTSPLCARPSVPQSPICRKPVVYHALCTTGSYLSQARCVTCPLYHRVRCVTSPLCTTPSVPQGPIYVTSPLSHSRELFMHRVVCVTVTFSRCTIAVVSLCHNVVMGMLRFMSKTSINRACPLLFTQEQILVSASLLWPFQLYFIP